MSTAASVRRCHSSFPRLPRLNFSELIWASADNNLSQSSLAVISREKIAAGFFPCATCAAILSANVVLPMLGRPATTTMLPDLKAAGELVEV